MKLELLKEKSKLTVKDLKERLNELGEEYDNVEISVYQTASDGSAWGVVAVGTCVSEDSEENPTFEIEVPVFRMDESEEGLTPENVFEAHLKESKGEDSDIISTLGYANLKEEDKRKVDEMIEEYNHSFVTA